jgi:hypothetical protein
MLIARRGAKCSKVPPLRAVSAIVGRAARKCSEGFTVVIGFLSVLQDKAQRLRLHANQPWAAQRYHAAHISFRTASATPLPVLIGYLSTANHCCHCPGVGLLKEFRRAPASPPTFGWKRQCDADGRKTEYLEWNTAHCRCGANVVEGRSRFQQSAFPQRTTSLFTGDVHGAAETSVA